MKKLLDTIKTIWEIPRGRAIISLCLWILFFIVCFGILNSGGSNNDIIDNEQPSFDNYEYEAIFNINSLEYNIEGIRYKDKELVEIKELKKEYINNFYNIKELYGFDLRYLRLEIIKATISNLTSKKEITYNDGSKKSLYEIKASDFKINDSDNYINDSLIELEVQSKNDNINKVEINLTNKMNKINPKLAKYNIEITYNNVGNIKDFALD